jgi:hypothetical protein
VSGRAPHPSSNGCARRKQCSLKELHDINDI